ncbi:MACPF domain-containing protein CAD1 [Vitis vinifera]|uniref:MACPF domain-containing protein CAD1 n=1 Tax=Vitis vinifera TaxID=29760 RepID=A0A438CDP7_VITVI|nr:MACPF domain-containing protein CAD1 [Vitis vinifera]
MEIQMAQHFNELSGISGSIPLGSFNAMFNFTGSWHVDAAATKSLAMVGYYIPLFTVELANSNLVLRDEIKRAVPFTWDPTSLASFIENYGTHIVTSATIGGRDVVYVRQHQSSPLSSSDIENYVKDIGDQRFLDPKSQPTAAPLKYKDKASICTACFNTVIASEIIFRRRGGDDLEQSHAKWSETVELAPDVINMKFVPIVSLLDSVPGLKHLARAVDLYLESRVWAPELNKLQRKEPVCPSLQFSLMGPKLYISPDQVTVGRKPVTGLRLSLEGSKQNRLAIHLQHLVSLPKILQPHWDAHMAIGAPKWQGPEEQDSRWFEPIKWKNFSHVSTAPIEHTEICIGDLSGVHIVTGAQLGVWDFGAKSVLHLKLLFSKVPGCTIRRSVWDHSPSTPSTSQKPDGSSSSLSNEKTEDKKGDSSSQTGKLIKIVDLTEMSKGPQDIPGHWLVTGAKLGVDKGKIVLRIKVGTFHVALESFDASCGLHLNIAPEVTAHGVTKEAPACVHKKSSPRKLLFSKDLVAMEKGELVEGKVDWKGRTAIKNKHGGQRFSSLILASFALENMATVALAVNLVTYFNGVMHFSIADAANELTNYMGTAYILSIVVAFLADAYIGRFYAVLVSAFIELVGLGLLAVQAHYPKLKPPTCVIFDPTADCQQVHGGNAALLFVALYLVAAGTAGIKAALPTHGADQFDEKDPQEAMQMSSFFNGLLLALCVGGAVSLTLVVWIQDNKGWDKGFGVPTLAIFLAMIVFAVGLPRYRIHVIQGTSAITEIIQVLVASFRNRKLPLPDDPAELYEIDKDKEAATEAEFLPHRDIYRFLDKAAIQTTLLGNSDKPETPNPWKLCRVTQVENAKIIAGMVPIFCCTIIMTLCLAQLQTFSIEQGLTMDTRVANSFNIPPASLPILPVIFMIILIPVYDRIFVPYARALLASARASPTCSALALA